MLNIFFGFFQYGGKTKKKAQMQSNIHKQIFIALFLTIWVALQGQFLEEKKVLSERDMCLAFILLK